MTLNPIAPNQTELGVGDTLFFFSYKTPVAARVREEDGKFHWYRTSKRHSVTTSKHTNAWLASVGAHDVETKEQSYFDNLSK